MKVKKFTAKTMPEAMKKVREELGDDAVILNSKRVENGGFLGMFKKKMIEVIAAVDPAANQAERKEQPPPAAPLSTPPAPQQTFSNAPAEGEAHKTSKDEQHEGLYEEVKQLKKMVRSISNENSDLPEELEQLKQRLENHEVDETLRLDITRHLLENWQAAQEADASAIERWLSDYGRSLAGQAPLGGLPKNRRFVNVVGPTGVGKTTTVAKMAAYFQLKKQYSVALITTDTYRIAAVDQLKTYARILNVPLSVAYSIDDFREAKEAYADYDLVLVDSAGRNFTNPLYVDELKRVMDFETEMVTYLVLALTSKYQDMKRIYEQFQLISIDKLIFTKLDETESYGAVWNFLATYQAGPAYFTNGQNVPDDIFEADAEAVAKLLNKDEHHE
ncbi:flagellar biosynthesis protein FlhF [Salsuginibacillus halophilus]|uniref:Flagellar biosynthesis protein FlhF n=1 Tax=Salsuginibacillus halophilus TaxID=517424 RepID=A0A2P8HY92_9BACI|nr:flagellar biosynthesis protein FlhF [Salsuginibacillus halophilus]PSL51208.1 flagellar biosynthesis protein FlhF [Salsuginibacillus halophilus]